MIYGNKYFNSLLENDIEISSKDVLFLSEHFQNLNLQDIVLEAAGNSPDKNKNALKKMYGQNIFSDISKAAKKAGDEIASLFKSDGVNKSTKKQAKTIIGKFYEFVNSIPKKAGEDYEKQIRILYNKINKDDASKIGQFYKAYIAFGGACLAGYVIMFILMPIFGQVAAAVIYSILIDPIIQNITLQAAIRGGYDKEYKNIALVFGITIGALNTKSIGGAIKSVAEIGVQFIIQKLTSSEKILNALKIKKESHKEIIKNIGVIISTALGVVFKLSAIKVPEQKIVVDTNAKDIKSSMVGYETGYKKNASLKDKADTLEIALKKLIKDKTQFKNYKKKYNY